MRVTRALLEGRNAREIAEAVGLSFHTVWTHIAHVLSKTGARGQAELVRLVARVQDP